MARGSGLSTASSSGASLLFGARKAQVIKDGDLKQARIKASMQLGDSSFLKAAKQLTARNPYPNQKKFANVNVVLDMPLMVNAKENNREYRGHVGIIGNEFVSIGAYGGEGQCGKNAFLCYQGPNLQEAINKLDDKLYEKSKKYAGYESPTAARFEKAFLDLQTNQGF